MSKAIDIIGLEIGRLTVLSFSHSVINNKSKYKINFFECLCSCGVKKPISKALILSGKIISCGCYNREATSLRSRKHADQKSKEYRAWSNLKSRCNNPKIRNYDRYGGRGIKVCDRWHNSYESFLEDMGRAPDKNYSIDRIDNNGNYEPGNCKWSTRDEQSNNMSHNIILEFRGERMSVAEWCRKLKISRAMIYHRIERGWTTEKMLTTPNRIAL